MRGNDATTRARREAFNRDHAEGRRAGIVRSKRETFRAVAVPPAPPNRRPPIFPLDAARSGSQAEAEEMHPLPEEEA